MIQEAGNQTIYDRLCQLAYDKHAKKTPVMFTLIIIIITTNIHLTSDYFYIRKHKIFLKTYSGYHIDNSNERVISDRSIHL